MARVIDAWIEADVTIQLDGMTDADFTVIGPIQTGVDPNYWND